MLPTGAEVAERVKGNSGVSRAVLRLDGAPVCVQAAVIPCVFTCGLSMLFLFIASSTDPLNRFTIPTVSGDSVASQVQQFRRKQGCCKLIWARSALHACA